MKSGCIAILLLLSGCRRALHTEQLALTAADQTQVVSAKRESCLTDERQAAKISLREALDELCRTRGLTYRVEPGAVVIVESTYPQFPEKSVLEALDGHPLAVYLIKGKTMEGTGAFSVAGYRVKVPARGVSVKDRARFIALVCDANEHANAKCWCTFNPCYIVIPTVEPARVHFLIDAAMGQWQTILDGNIVDDSHYHLLGDWIEQCSP